MSEQDKIQAQLNNEPAELRRRMTELEAGAAASKPEDLIAERQKTEQTLPQREQEFKTLLEAYLGISAPFTQLHLTERVQTEEAYHTLVEHSLQGLLIIQEGHIVFANPAMANLSGYTSQELRSLAWDDLRTIVHSEDREWVRQNLQNRLAGKPVSPRYELRFVHKDGQEHWVEALVNRVDYRHKPAVQVACVDITERKRAEKELQRRNRELALLNRVITASAASLDLKAILETTCHESALAFEVPQAAAFLLNAEKTEATVVAEFLTNGQPSILNEVIPVAGNPVAQYLFTHKTPLVIKDTQSDPRLALIRDLLRRRGTISFLINPLIIEGEGVGAFSLAATQPRDFSPEEIDLSCNVARQIAGAVGRIRLAEAHQQLIEQYHQAQKMEAMGQLVGGISHDFKNLLMAINGFAELIQSRSELNEGQQEMVGYILSAGQRAADLIHRLLAFSQKQTVEPQVLTLNTLVTNLNKMLRRIINENIHIETALAPDLWPVKADPTQLEQVIINLAINARDAMPVGGQLTLKTANVVLDEVYTRQHFDIQPGAYVLLVVSDTGLGMNAETQAHIFEPFFTTKARGQGTGLGLATVYGIVKQNHGDIWVYSEAGQGTTFKIYLPRAEAAASPPTHDEAIADKPRGNETILLIEDEAQVRELAQIILTQQGYTVLVAEDGQKALQVVADHPGPIHLLLSDVIMPGMNGKDITGQLSRTHPDLKILFMSGHSDETLAHCGVLEPGVAFLPKPFGPMVMANKVREVLDAG